MGRSSVSIAGRLLSSGSQLVSLKCINSIQILAVRSNSGSDESLSRNNPCLPLVAFRGPHQLTSDSIKALFELIGGLS